MASEPASQAERDRPPRRALAPDCSPGWGAPARAEAHGRDDDDALPGFRPDGLSGFDPDGLSGFDPDCSCPPEYVGFSAREIWDELDADARARAEESSREVL